MHALKTQLATLFPDVSMAQQYKLFMLDPEQMPYLVPLLADKDLQTMSKVLSILNRKEFGIYGYPLNDSHPVIKRPSCEVVQSWLKHIKEKPNTIFRNKHKYVFHSESAGNEAGIRYYRCADHETLACKGVWKL